MVSVQRHLTQFVSAEVTGSDHNPELRSTETRHAGKVETKIKTLSASEPGCYSELAHKGNRTPVGNRTVAAEQSSSCVTSAEDLNYTIC